MLVICCPWCGPRAESEFVAGGEGGIVRPTQSDEMSDVEWGDYVFMRKNLKGVLHEQWCHAAGCGQWFNALRDTVTYQVHATWRPGEAAPSVSPDQMGQ